MLIPVLLSGGSGTRLWPLSRKNLPKQFLPLAGDLSLFQQTVTRTQGLPGVANPIVVCSEDHRFMVAEQMQMLGVAGASILLEPVARNTAPAIALAALQALAADPDAILLVLPADHLIGDTDSFSDAVRSALPLAEEGWLVTFGIRPEAPETGFGYIRRGNALSDTSYQVDAFVEKPDLATAEAYLDSGAYDWNSGMFLFQASRLLEELAQQAPAIHAGVVGAFESAHADLDFVRIDKDVFGQVPEDSIDYAVMVKTPRAAVVPVRCKWSDIGSWEALWATSERDCNGNRLEGDVLALDSSNSYARSSQRRMVALLGVEDLVVVDTPDAVLVYGPQSRTGCEEAGRSTKGGWSS